jgi:hypothetical protein
MATNVLAKRGNVANILGNFEAGALDRPPDRSIPAKKSFCDRLDDLTAQVFHSPIRL